MSAVGWAKARSAVPTSEVVGTRIIGPAHRVRPLAGPMAGSGGTRWLCPPYAGPAGVPYGQLQFAISGMSSPCSST
jgi:hypothetical protein